MPRLLRAVWVGGFSLAIVATCAVTPGNADGGGDEGGRIARGLRIAPVPLHLRHRNVALVGLGSYLVNAAGGCNDCHTCPSYASNPYDGKGTGAVNAANYLAGGVPFGPVSSANLTPDLTNGLPAGGHTFKQFASMIRTGHDADENRILQVMPWPVYRNLTDHDLRAIYEYLGAIPHAEPGVCQFAGQ